VEKGEATMHGKGKPAAISVMVLLLVFASSTVTAGGKRTQDLGHSGKSCPHLEVKKVEGSKIRFMEDTYDFGQIPVDRKVSHNFRFENVGTAPLLLAQHVESKPIEGC
jgi:hypothetical protein